MGFMPKGKAAKKHAAKWGLVGVLTGIVIEWIVPEQFNPITKIKGLFTSLMGGN